VTGGAGGQGVPARGGRAFGPGAVVPFVTAGRIGGPGGTLDPGSYLVRLTVGGQTLTTSVVVVEDIWMKAER
jgi:hypothetical protein